MLVHTCACVGRHIVSGEEGGSRMCARRMCRREAHKAEQTQVYRSVNVHTHDANGPWRCSTGTGSPSPNSRVSLQRCAVGRPRGGGGSPGRRTPVVIEALTCLSWGLLVKFVHGWVDVHAVCVWSLWFRCLMRSVHPHTDRLKQMCPDFYLFSQPHAGEGRQSAHVVDQGEG